MLTKSEAKLLAQQLEDFRSEIVEWFLSDEPEPGVEKMRSELQEEADKLMANEGVSYHESVYKNTEIGELEDVVDVIEQMLVENNANSYDIYAVLDQLDEANCLNKRGKLLTEIFFDDYLDR